MGRGLQCDQPTDKRGRELLASHHQAHHIPCSRHIRRLDNAQHESRLDKETYIRNLLAGHCRSGVGTVQS